jgi:peptidoglycan/xylan/chitin deacetylase (PgdA/CDA1 family)/signal transduction histidine kinase
VGLEGDGRNGGADALATRTETGPELPASPSDLVEQATWAFADRRAGDRRRNERRQGERTRLEDLERSQRAAVHDLNNLLWIVENQVTLLEVDEPTARRRQQLGALRAAIADCATVADSMLSARRREPSWSHTLDVHDVITDVVQMIRLRPSGDATIELALHAQTATVPVPRAVLVRTLLNLITNALDAMGDTGTITIVTDNPGASPPLPYGDNGSTPGTNGSESDPRRQPLVRIRVRDTGPGIDPVDLERVFVRGFTTKPHHAGLGLDSSRQLVTEHSGRLEVENTPDGGALFTVLLPTAVAVPPVQSNPASPPWPNDLVPLAPPPPRRRYWALRDRVSPEQRHAIRRVADRVAGPVVGSIAGVHADQATNGHRSLVGLTFDDGPHRSVTLELLALLHAAQTKATFFLLVDAAEGAPDLVRALIDDGHEVGLHGMDHRRLTRLAHGDLEKHLREGRDRLSAITGQPILLFRPPFGAQSLRSYVAVRRLGMVPVVWSADAEDWVDQPTTRVVDRAVGRATPGGILLLHEVARPEAGFTAVLQNLDPVQVAAGVIEGLRERGLEPTTVSELLAAGPARRTVWFRP